MEDNQNNNVNNQPQENIQPDAGQLTAPQQPTDPVGQQPANLPTEVTPTVDTSPPPVQPPAKKKMPRKVLVSGLLVVVIAVACGFFALSTTKKTSHNKNSSTSQNTSEKNSPLGTDKIKAQIAKFIKPTTGEVWYKQYKKLPDQHYYRYGESDAVPGEGYYELGKRGNNVIIAHYGEGNDGRLTFDSLFEKSADGTVSAITRPDANAKYDAKYDARTAETFATHIKVDAKTHYDSISIPEEIKLKSGLTLKAFEYFNLGDPYIDGPGYIKSSKPDDAIYTNIYTLGSSEILENKKTFLDTHLTGVNYYVKLPTNTIVLLDYAPIGRTTDGISWNNGFKDKTSFSSLRRDCTLLHSITIADNVSDSDFVVAGKTADGQTLYDFKDKNNPLVKKTYQDFVTFASPPNNPPEGVDMKSMNITKFINNHAIFAYKDNMSRWQIYRSSKYSPVWGCGKPVVYLYPVKPTQVTVKVGADVKISDPLYNPSTGWHALAYPSGKLIVGNHQYDSLFWEGQGYGDYPGITAGTVVKRSDAVATMRSQLLAQGLNAKEIQDFMDYWSGKVPNKPYIRLTWFTTNEINRLAPLSISPKPDTVFRVFLDMDGLDSPIKLPAQKLHKINRKGFTVVEWGGLLSGL